MFFYELEEFGWNWLTLSSLVVVTITTLQYYTSVQQAHSVWYYKSARAVSIGSTTILAYVYAAALIYGLITKSFVITYTGGLVFPTLVIAAGAWKFRAAHWRDGIFLVGGCVGLWMYTQPVDPQQIFFWFNMAVSALLVEQLWILYLDKSRGVQSGNMLVAYLIKNFALMTFSLVGNEPVYQYFTPFWFLMSVWAFIKWQSLPPFVPAEAERS